MYKLERHLCAVENADTYIKGARLNELSVSLLSEIIPDTQAWAVCYTLGNGGSWKDAMKTASEKYSGNFHLKFVTCSM